MGINVDKCTATKDKGLQLQPMLLTGNAHDLLRHRIWIITVQKRGWTNIYQRATEREFFLFTTNAVISIVLVVVT